MAFRKCDFGYGKKHFISVLVLTIILLALSFGIYFLGVHITGDNKNLLTLVAVLGMLPAGKEIVNLIMCFRAKKYSCPDNIYNNIVSVSNDKVYIRYDLYVTSYDNIFPLYALTCYENSLIGLSAKEGFKSDKFDEHINTLLSQNGLKVSNIKIFDKESKFIERIQSFSETGNDHNENDLKVIKLMENISL